MASIEAEYEQFEASEAAALDYLLQADILQTKDIEQAESLRDSTRKSVLITLNQIGVLKDHDLAKAYSKVTGLPVMTADAPIPDALPEELNPEFLRDTQSVLLSTSGPLAAVNPLDKRMLAGIEFAIGHVPSIIIAEAGDWSRLFSRIYPGNALDISSGEEDTALAIEIADHDRDAPIVRQVASWLSEAADTGASDVHFETRRSEFEVFYRVDGVLRSVSRSPKSGAAAVIARIKVIADLDLGERNRAQDGRATIVVRGRRLDIRVSIIPTIDGESAVIRLLDRPNKLLTLEGLGFTGDIAEALESICEKRHGMFVVAGPTGSGKTTTLYSCLEQLKHRGLKILSVEDPVEYHFEHVSQVQISDKSGRTFAGALRSFLRHDPDVIMVGEIRDPETAQVAVQAALSGHLVFATLHAIDASRIRTRLEDMGVEPFKLEACLVGSMAQRLVRILCPNCRQPSPLTEQERSLFERHNVPLPEHTYSAEGCAECRHEGYLGRTALAEFAYGATAPEASRTLIRQALQLTASGQTSSAEVASLIEP
ncbi:hypothetical protein HY29_17905 [Hyphomonas beringensis]|uniref:Bacterial type II secretion system protein E domain-containing protein n=1 Tax=Hyphomonas beringensis TaxID=1280946 RepID=A0A062TXM2_9PROT|nr:GspE/PulE family protein [Hyphomonas beringensis]KCZ52816.1 hypothetical protein HY29_17905 [Hyphomonas beringensis]